MSFAFGGVHFGFFFSVQSWARDERAGNQRGKGLQSCTVSASRTKPQRLTLLYSFSIFSSQLKKFRGQENFWIRI